MPKFIGVVRVSTDKQKESGLGEEAQQHAIERWLAYQKGSPKYAGYDVGPVLVEPKSVSARKVPLFKRPVGQKLLTLCQPGDVIVFAVHDRAFRDVLDAEQTRAWAAEKGVTLHFCNLNIDLSTKEGRLTFRLMVSAAQYESDAISDRTKNAYAAKLQREPDYIHHGERPRRMHKRIRTVLNGKVRRNQEIIDREQVRIFQQVCYYKSQGWEWFDIADRVEEALAAREGREPLPSEFKYFGRGPTRKYSVWALKRFWINREKLRGMLNTLNNQRRETAQAELARKAARREIELENERLRKESAGDA